MKPNPDPKHVSLHALARLRPNGGDAPRMRLKHLVRALSTLAISSCLVPAQAATFVVTSTVASGPGSLDDALSQLETAGGGLLQFAVPAGSVLNAPGTPWPALSVPATLTSGSDIEIGSPLASARTVTLSGPGQLTIDAAFAAAAAQPGATGDAGVFGTGFSFVNTGTVSGGHGGDSLNGATAPDGGAAVDGTGYTLLNRGGTLTGGQGGTGTPNLQPGGDGGKGGAGVSGSGFRFTNAASSTVVGGQGGDNGDVASGQSGHGGEGGAGVWAAGAADVVVNHGSVTGGMGGHGGDAAWSTAGNGGLGGIGIQLTGADASVLNDGAITGGRGGYGGSGNAAGNGGDGGVGLVAAGTGATIVNTGSIEGGAGGNPGSGNGNSWQPGVGGVAVILAGNGNTLVNSGGIAGGLPGYGAATPVQADAIRITGSGNTLELRAGSTITGQVVSTGSANTLALGGAANGAFDLGLLDTQYTGFARYAKSGAGAWTLTHASATPTNWTITGGTLALASGASLAGGSVALAAAGTVFDISAAGDQSLASLTGVGGSTVALGANTLTFHNADGQTFDGSFTGSGTLVKTGAGMQIFNGNSAGFTGLTSVMEGALEVGDADHADAVMGGSVQVGANGVLRGHGAIVGDVINNGLVAPGGSIGTLSVGGNYSQAANATLAIEVSPTQASMLRVGGSAALNGGLAITYDPGTYTARRYTIVSATGGVVGRFANVSSTGASYLGALTPGLAYGANDVDLVLAGADSGTGVGADPGAGAGGGPVVVAPTDTSIYTAMGTAAMLAAQADSDTLLNRYDRAVARGNAGGPASWMVASGSRTKIGGTDGAPGFDADRYGFLAGLERGFGDYTGGIAGGYSHTDLDERHTGDSGTIDTLRAGVYGGRAFGPANVSVAASVGLDFMSQKRPFAGIGAAEGDHTGQTFTLSVQASLPLRVGTVAVTPRAGLRYAYLHADAFDESGARGQNLDVDADNVRSLQPYVGVTFEKSFGDAQRPVAVQLQLGYAQELLDGNRRLDVSAQDGTRFRTAGTDLPRGYFTTGLGVTMHPAKAWSVALRYNALINTGHASAQSGDLSVAYRF